MSWKKRICWAAVAAGVLALAGGVGFWMRPVSYFNAANELRMCLSDGENHSVEVAGHRVQIGRAHV